ncbi:MAG: alkaline phosphatase family protein [Sandaracinaceae bacterium]|nr:alkaline phosphatase family protein [Sandaracinaceae bacterium]
MSADRVLVVGLDCAAPALVFDRLARALPNLSALRRRGAWGRLRSVAPPITVPAWACMVSGRDPGELGRYGFRERAHGAYELALGAGTTEAPRVWDLASAHGKTSCVLYVPMTSPPPRVRGVSVGDFLGVAPPYTHPPELAARLEARFGPHAPDVSEFRTDALDRLLDELYETTRRRFAIGRALFREERPDLTMMVEMGTDRLHHAMWRHLDPSHPDHDPHDPRVRDARDYYAFVDAELGAWLDEAGEDTTVLVVSDHGARPMRGAVAINEWLRREGWLVLSHAPPQPSALTPAMVDWTRTRAWSAGGYYARVFLNLRGREPEGIVTDREAALAELALALEADPALRARAHRPEALYRQANGAPPDLLVFFGELDYRSSGLVGGDVLAADDGRGPDGCNHDWDGIVVAAGPAIASRGELAPRSIHDVGPTILGALGLATPPDWLGSAIP